MMMAVEQVAKGATSIEERLKDVLKHLESESETLLVTDFFFVVTVQYTCMILVLQHVLVTQMKSLPPPPPPLSSSL